MSFIGAFIFGMLVWLILTFFEFIWDMIKEQRAKIKHYGWHRYWNGSPWNCVHGCNEKVLTILDPKQKEAIKNGKDFEIECNYCKQRYLINSKKESLIPISNNKINTMNRIKFEMNIKQGRWKCPWCKKENKLNSKQKEAIRNSKNFEVKCEHCKFTKINNLKGLNFNQ